MIHTSSKYQKIPLIQFITPWRHTKMTEQSLNGTDNLIGRTLLSLRYLNQCRLSTSICLIILFVMSGCSSLHVNVSPAVNWEHVKVVALQSPSQDPWNLNQAIRSELTDLGFQIDDSGAKPDLLFSYSTQVSPDLTDDGEVITRLNSLHIQFMDPATNTPVTAVDYFYPAVSNPPAPETGVKKVFLGLRQQVLTENNPPAAASALQPSQTMPLAPVVVAPPTQDQEPPSVQLQPDPAPTSTKVEENVASDQLQQRKPVEIKPTTEPTVLKTSDNNTLKPVQKTRSPWLPKLKSWGFENWGQDSSDEF
jgi:hypothetical protein